MAYFGSLQRYNAPAPAAPASGSVAKKIGVGFVVLSCATLGGAWVLWRVGARAAAASLIVLSPAPCPPGLPC